MTKRDAVTHEDSPVPTYIVMQCVVCQEIDYQKEADIVAKGSKCPFCGAPMRAQGSVR